MKRRREDRRTLQDANMLCRVTQTATTLNTGDHSFPNIEAQIYRAGECAAAIRRGRVHTCPLEYTCCVLRGMSAMGRKAGTGTHGVHRRLFPIRYYKLDGGRRYRILSVESELERKGLSLAPRGVA